MQDERSFDSALTDDAGKFIGVPEKTSFITQSGFVRIDREEIAFLRHEIDRQVVDAFSDNDKIRSRTGALVIEKFQ